MNQQDREPAPPYVIVIDDDEAPRKLHAKVLRDSGYDVDAVASGAVAIELVRRQCPDAIVADLMLGDGMDGDELARRCLDLCPRTRVVFVSGFDESRLREAGITQVVFLRKPISPRRLQAMMRELLGR